MTEPADELERLGREYAAKLASVDGGVLTIIELASEQAPTQDDQAMICAFFNSVQELASTSAESATALTEFIQALDQVAGFSRELRPPLQKIRDALRGVRDAQAIIDEWVRRIDSSPIDCTEIASLPLT